MVTFAPVTAPIIIDGVTVYNPIPSPCFVDLDKECIVPIGGDVYSLNIEDICHDIDNIAASGVLPNKVRWDITHRNTNGFADILIDAAEVTEETLRQLIAAKVVTVC